MELIRKAIILASNAHVGQTRKGSDIPYIVHPFSVGMTLQKQGCSEDVIAAGILHDTVEDTWVTLDYLKNEFGERIANLVEAVSEPEHSKVWESRKQHTIEFLKTAPLEVRMIACADKLDNLTSTYNDYHQLGEEVWARFKRGRKEQEWYYRSLVNSLCIHNDIPAGVTIFDELRAMVEKFFGKS